MEFGIALTPSTDSWRVVQRAEEIGFTHAWFYDSQLLYTDVFVSMALAAEHTSRIKLGTGVLIPTNRIAPVAANAFASLNRLAPGRVIFGVGTGFTGRNTMGLPAQKLDDMAAYIRVVQAMLRGETVEFATEGTTRKVRFLNPENGMLNLDDPVPVHISAFGPRGRALTAKAADGWMTFMGPVEAAIHQVGAIDQACRDAGRDPATLYKTIYSLGCVLEPGEPADSPRAMAQAGPGSAVSWHGMIENFSRLQPAMREAAGAYRQLYESYAPADARYLSLHKGHLLFVRDDERAFVTADMIRGGTFTASAPELRERVERLAAAGFDQLTIQLVHGQEAAVEDWAKLFGLR
ncbi:MAG: LLM class flavin-dependent oxidoreductase [Dehalococcoidia bacterium]